MDRVIATHINQYHVCIRQLWLHAHDITMEHNSDIVAEGKLIGETTYERRSEKYSELALSTVLPFAKDITASAKMDFYNPNTHTVHETKRGKTVEQAHKAQVQFYLYLLYLSGVTEAQGIIEYPDLRLTQHVTLEETDISLVQNWILEVNQIIKNPVCPKAIYTKFCKNCSFFDLCYINE